MRRFLAFLLLLPLLLPVRLSAATPRATVSTAVLDVRQMTCPLCGVTVRKALEKSPGVLSASVDYNHKTASVRFDPDKTSPTALAQVVTRAGYPATPHAEARQ